MTTRNGIRAKQEEKIMRQRQRNVEVTLADCQEAWLSVLDEVWDKGDIQQGRLTFEDCVELAAERALRKKEQQ